MIKDTYGIAVTQANMAISLRDLGRMSESVEMLFKSNDQYARIGEVRRQAGNYITLGSIYRKFGRDEEGVAAFQKAADMALEIESYPYYCAATSDMAVSLMKMGKVQEAESILTENGRYARKLGEPYYIISNLIAYANLYAERPNPDLPKAIAYRRKAIELAAQSNNQFFKLNSVVALAMLETDMGNHQEAIRLIVEHQEEMRASDFVQVIADARKALAQAFPTINQ